MKYKPNYSSDLVIVMENIHEAPLMDPDKLRDPFLFLTCSCGNVEGLPVHQKRSDFGSFLATESQESPDGMTYSCLQCRDENNSIKVEIDEGTEDDDTHLHFNVDGMRSHHRNHLRATVEMLHAHEEKSRCNSVMLEFFPEMGERTEPLSVLLREIFKQKRDQQLTRLPDINAITLPDDYSPS